jgi:hypothetical protein
MARVGFVDIDSGRVFFPPRDYTAPLGSGLRLALVILRRDLSRNGHWATRVCQGCCSFDWPHPAPPTLDARDCLLLSVFLSFPFGLALARAETLRPAPGVALLRANSARPPGFGSPGNISNLSQPRLDEILPVPPKKHGSRLGSSSRSLSGCPSQTGRKGVTDACISIA